MKLIKTIPMDQVDPGWKERIKRNWWATNFEGDIAKCSSHQKRLLELRDHLISFGGEECSFPFPNKYVDKILERGFIKIRQHDINNVKEEYDVLVGYAKGLRSMCHDNSAELWYQMKDKPKFKDKLKIMTGYALSEDGMWRQHSWCILQNTEEFNGMDIYLETTEERLAYFGFIMDEVEAYEFRECI